MIFARFGDGRQTLALRIFDFIKRYWRAAAGTFGPLADDANLPPLALPGAHRRRLLVVARAHRRPWRAALDRTAQDDPERTLQVRIALLIDGDGLILRNMDRSAVTS